MIDYGFFEHDYPYTNFHEMNLDWILRQMIELRSDMRNFVNQNTIKYADPIQWNITTQYEGNTVVIEPNSGNAYISSQPVPAGVPISNTDYWSVIGNFSILYASIKEAITDLDEENRTFADQDIPKDKLLWLNDKLYQAIIDIPIGTVFVDSGEYANIKNVSVEEFLDAAMESITNIKTGYNKVYDVVHDMVTDDTIEAGQTVKTNGYYSINDQGASYYKIREITSADIISQLVDESTSKTGLIRINDTLCAELQIFDVIETMAFGVKDDGSAAFQNLLDYCATKNIQNVIFSSDMELSDCEIKSNINIDLNGYTITGISYHSDTNAIRNILKTNGNYNIVVKNGNIRGYTNKTGVTSVGDNYAIFDFSNANDIECSYLDFQYIDQIRVTYSYENGLASIIRCRDVKYTHIHHCYFNHVNGYELNGVWCVNKDRTYSDSEIDHNIYDTDVLTSTFDTNGNNCRIHHNEYKFTYGGSAVNCFALNLMVYQELITGSFESVYDQCEGDFYQGNNVSIEQITMSANVQNLAYIAASNIKIKNIVSFVSNCLVRLFTGYSSRERSPLPNISNSLLPYQKIIMENIRCASRSAIIGAHNDVASNFMLCTIRDCYLPAPHATHGAFFFGHPTGGEGSLIIENCGVRIDLITSISSSNPYVAYLGGEDYPTYLRLINCNVANRTRANQETLFSCGSNAVKFYGIGNTTNSTNASGDLICAGANTSKIMGLNEKLS